MIDRTRFPARSGAWSLALLLAASPGCKSKDPAASDPPSISSLSLLRTSAGLREGGGSVPVGFTLEVADAGANVSSLTLTILDAAGAQVGQRTGTVQNPPGATIGTLGGSLSIPTTALGALVLRFQAADTQGAQSNVLEASFTVVPGAPVPTLASISPTAAEAGSGDLVLTVTGSDFVAGSAISWNGTQLPTTFVDATTLRAAVPSYFLQFAGTVQVSVNTPPPGGGTSAALPFTVTPPPPRPVPVLTALTPSSAEAGSGDLPITLTGSDFSGSSQVLWNGYSSLATTFVSATELRATIPGYHLYSAGTAQVSVYTPSPGGGSSSALVFTIAPPAPRPVPVLTALTPSSAEAGSGDLELTVTGSDFSRSSQVQWNGSFGLATTFVSTTELRATLPAYQLAQVGRLPVTVVTPAPGGGTSSAVPFEVRLPAMPGVTAVALPANDVEWDPYGRKLYVTLPSTSPRDPNTLAVVDPYSGLLEASQFAGSEPGALALSDDGRFLYLGHGGASEVTRFLLPDRTPDLTIPLGTDPAGGAFYLATALRVAPGAPRTWAASLTSSGYSGATAVFDDATARASKGGLSTSVCWAGSGGTLVAGLGGYPGAFTLHPVSSSGLGAPTSLSGTYAAGQPEYDAGTGLVYLPDGRAIDPATAGLVGTFSAGYGGPVAPDSSLGSAFFATGNVGGPLELRAHDLSMYLPARSMTLSYVAGPARRMLRWGADGLALLSNGIVILVRGPFVLPVATSPNPVPAVTALTPGSSRVGSGNLRLTVDGTGFVPGSVVQVNGAERSTRRVSPTQLVAYLPASDLAAAGTASITVVNPAPGGGASAATLFTIAP